MEQKTMTSQLVTVTNRNNGYTGYPLPNGGHRNFSIGQSRKIDLEELRELKNMDGGEYLLKNFFIIDDMDALSFLDIHPEPEYFYTEVEIKKLLSNECSLEQLEDALNFAPDGVIELIKDVAVKTELNDIKKRDLIFEKTGFNVSNALMVNKVLEEPTEEKKEEAPKRRAAAVTVEDTGRKAAPIETKKSSSYKIID